PILKLQRYEVALQNMLFRSIHELERLERFTKGEDIPAPTVHDVTFHDVTTNVEPPATDRLQTPHSVKTSPVANPKNNVSDSVTAPTSTCEPSAPEPEDSPHISDSAGESGSTTAGVLGNEPDFLRRLQQSQIPELIPSERSDGAKDNGT